jgi:DNA-directed RNA polymerase subunit RPC12/RpoP
MKTGSPDETLIPPYRCADCGSEVGFRSRRRSITERFLLPLFLLQPVRCGECFRRDYRLIFVKVRDRLSDAPKVGPVKPPATSNRNVA